MNQREFSREWVDQILGQIQPRIDGLKIFPVHVGPELSDYCYVIEIPASGTAHQARDLRYYRRRNFESTAMEDYEVRDVMNRRKNPIVTTNMRIVWDYDGLGPAFAFQVHNTSKVIAIHFAVSMLAPLKLSKGRAIRPSGGALVTTKGGVRVWTCSVVSGGPLFPESMQILYLRFEHIYETALELEDTTTSFALTVYADEMEKVDLTKDLAGVEGGWV